MATVADISVGLSHEFAITACKAGWEPKDFAVLAHSEDRLRALLTFVRGDDKITTIDHIIDCDADPFVPSSRWTVEEHRKCGQMKWYPSKVLLYLSPNQTGEKTIEGHNLRKELAEQPVLNANVLDYLLKKPALIPKEWKGKFIFAWGTVYRSSGGNLCVRYLYWYDGGWGWSDYWLDYDWYCNYPALVAQVSA